MKKIDKDKYKLNKNLTDNQKRWLEQTNKEVLYRVSEFEKTLSVINYFDFLEFVKQGIVIDCEEDL